MNNIEKKLAEKVMYAIYIKNDNDVIGCYLDYRDYSDLLKDKKDIDLRNKIDNNYRKYFESKIGLIR